MAACGCVSAGVVSLFVRGALRGVSTHWSFPARLPSQDSEPLGLVLLDNNYAVALKLSKKSRALQRLSVKEVWVVFSDAADTRSSWFPKLCRFGASPHVITIFFHTRQTTNISCRFCVCMFVTSVCACLASNFGVCIIDFDVCVESEWVFWIVGEDWGFWCCCWCRFGFNYSRNCECFPNKCRTNVRARQDETFSSLFHMQSCCCDWQPAETTRPVVSVPIAWHPAWTAFRSACQPRHFGPDEHTRLMRHRAS